MTKSIYDEFVEDRENLRLVEQEYLILTATEKICEWMEENDVSRTQLADRIGKTPAYVSQLLSGSRNMTLRTLADLAFALDRRVELQDARLQTELQETKFEGVYTLDPSPPSRLHGQVEGWVMDPIEVRGTSPTLYRAA